MAPELDRRRFLKALAAGAAVPAIGSVLAACGSDTKAQTSATTAGSTPSNVRRKVKIGFIALTDCASVLMAKELGYFDKRLLDVELIKQASWPATRDNLMNGQIDAAHC